MSTSTVTDTELLAALTMDERARATDRAIAAKRRKASDEQALLMAARTLRLRTGTCEFHQTGDGKGQDPCTVAAACSIHKARLCDAHAIGMLARIAARARGEAT